MIATETIKDCITPTLVREVFEDSILSEQKGWYITVCGKIVTVDGKIFYERRDQAVNALRNSFSFRARRAIHNKIHNDNSYWWRSEDATRYWTVFKKVLEEEYGLKILHA
jgi:hypothetical protein